MAAQQDREALPRTILFLNALSFQQKLELFQKMVRDVTIRDHVAPGVLRGIRPEALGLLINPHFPALDGQFWLRFVTCSTPHGLLQHEHRIYQFRFPAGHQQRKIFTHVVAFAAHNEGPLPRLGRGASIDHLCGQMGCSRATHLALAPAHRDNVARIGCAGVTLVVMQNAIIRMVPCPHAPAQEDADLAVQHGCAKVFVVEIRIEDL
eukprot:m.228178 g.228178  ORF g.228178 m.228178 type:complete len:207 (-) comp17417_c0_seq1:144-764(-)